MITSYYMHMVKTFPHEAFESKFPEILVRFL